MSESTFSGTAGLIALRLWIRQIGVTDITGWRWEKKGWIHPINICGRKYITKDDSDQFTARAQAGEFAQEHKVPSAGNREAA